MRFILVSVLALALAGLAAGCVLPLSTISNANAANTKHTPFHMCLRVDSPSDATNKAIKWATTKIDSTTWNWFASTADNFWFVGHIYRIASSSAGTNSDWSGAGKLSLTAATGACTTSCTYLAGYTESEVTFSAADTIQQVVILDGTSTHTIYAAARASSTQLTSIALSPAFSSTVGRPIAGYQPGVIVYSNNGGAFNYAIGDGATYTNGNLYFEVGQLYSFVPSAGTFTNAYNTGCATVDGQKAVFALAATTSTNAAPVAVTTGTVWGSVSQTVNSVALKVSCAVAYTDANTYTLHALAYKPTTTGDINVWGSSTNGAANSQTTTKIGTNTKCTPSSTTICVKFDFDYANVQITAAPTGAVAATNFKWYASQGATQWTSATTDTVFGSYSLAKVATAYATAHTFSVIPFGFGSTANNVQSYAFAISDTTAATFSDSGVNTANSFTQALVGTTAQSWTKSANVGSATGSVVLTPTKRCKLAAFYYVSAATGTVNGNQIDVYPVFSAVAAKTGSTTLTLSPSFASTTFAYNITLTNTQSSLTLTPTDSLDAGLTTKATSGAYKGTAVTASSGAFTSNIDLGSTTFTNTITADSSTTLASTTYTFTVKRQTAASNYVLVTICTTALGASTYCHDTGSGPKSALESASRFGASALTLTSGVATTFEATGSGDFATNPYILTTSSTGGCGSSCPLVTGTAALSAAGQTTGFTPSLTTIIYYQNSAKTGWGSAVTVVNPGSTGSVTNPCISAPWLCSSASSALVSLVAIVAPLVAIFAL